MSELRSISERLAQIAATLRDPDLADAQAEALAREAADLAARAGNEIERAARGGEAPAR